MLFVLRHSPTLGCAGDSHFSSNLTQPNNCALPERITPPRRAHPLTFQTKQERKKKGMEVMSSV